MNYGMMTAKDPALHIDAAKPLDFQSPCSEIDHVLGTRSGNALRHPCLVAVRQVFAFSVGLHMNWLKLIAYYAKPCFATANSCGRQARPSAEVLERSMDIAIGIRAS